MKCDTIAAIATAVNNSGISVIRISGNEAIDIVSKVFVPNNKNKDLKKVKSHTVHYGYIYDTNEIVDEVLVIVMKAPNTYTREDVVEIDCHGGVVVTKRIIDIILKNGATAAMPGEFTKRAFLNGRIDLSQAEAVMDLINSKSELALKSSLNQLKGSVMNKINELRKIIINDVAFIEAALDDPEHIEIDGYKDKMLVNVKNCIGDINKLINSYDNGKIIKEGIDTVIVGKPNAGKSSFLNSLIGENRAIVTDVAGTTRDVIKEEININGLLLNIMDTAGIRQTEDIVEKIGIDKTVEYMDKADLIIFIVDCSTKIDENDIEIMEKIRNRNAIILLNKTDLEALTDINDIKEYSDKKIIMISAKNSQGIDDVEKELYDMFFDGNIDFNDEIFISNARQKEALGSALESLNNVVDSIESGMPEDFYSIDMMGAYESLGLVNGEALEDDLADTIFREFCMGK